MGGGSAELDYAREVYAACATIGFESPESIRLKALLDAADAHHSDLDEIVALAQMVQRASIAWAGRPGPR